MTENLTDTERNLTDIESAHLKLVTGFFDPPYGELPHPGLVTAIAIGIPPDSSATGESVSTGESLIIFLDTAASGCEEQDILNDAKALATPFVPLILRAGPFEGLQAAPGDSIFPVNPGIYNIPPIGVGTFGLVAVAEPGGQQYAVSSNHVLANNGRTPAGTKVYFPGPVEDATNGSAIAAFTGCVSLNAPAWPVRSGAAPNTVDCAWAELTSPLTPAPPPPPEVTLPATPITTGTVVTKQGRTTEKTTSTIRFRRWWGFVNFNFGTYFFVDQLATYDAAGTDPFAAPGDSGSAALQGTATGVGLVSARGYHYGLNGDFEGYIILICPLETIAQEMELSLGTIKFYGATP